MRRPVGPVTDDIDDAKTDEEPGEPIDPSRVAALAEADDHRDREQWEGFEPIGLSGRGARPEAARPERRVARIGIGEVSRELCWSGRQDWQDAGGKNAPNGERHVEHPVWQVAKRGWFLLKPFSAKVNSVSS